MANEYLVNSDDLVAVATAIREKGGTENPLIFPDGFISAVQEIQTGGDGTVEDFVRFYDYDGTLLYIYTLSDAKKLTSFPDAPSHSGLVFDGWNYTLEKMQNLTTSRNIYALYSTDDETTRIYVHLKEGRTSPMLGICLNGTVTVDWGDGTTADVLTGTDLTTAVFTPLHNYSKSGNYVIKLTIAGNAQLCGESSNDNGSYILRRSADGGLSNRAYQSSIYKIEIGSRIGIGDYAFNGCYSLTSITMPIGATSIGNYAFQKCYSLPSISLPDGLTSIGNYAFEYCVSLTSISLPDGLTSIGDWSFSWCSSLTSISIPDGLTKIGDATFNACFSLTSISLPDGVTSIGGYAFGGCRSITSISLPNGLTRIDPYAFSNCQSLTSISIPDGVTNLIKNAFQNCYSLSSVSLPDGLTGIGENVFSGCYSLTNISLPDGLTGIGDGAFEYCYSLANISFPDGVTSIGHSAFYDCSGVKYYDFSSLQSIPTLGNGLVFDGLSSDCEIRVPAALADEWKAATYWKIYANYIVGV